MYAGLVRSLSGKQLNYPAMLVNIEVNNKKIKAKKGETILSALKANGIKIPSLCSMKEFTPTGACRMCVVEIEGREGLMTSCSQPVEEWMKIKTHSPRVVKARKTIVELLLSNHPDDCLYCARNGNCELQDMAEELSVRERRILGKKNKYKLDHSSPSIVVDPAKCILCGRCVRVCGEVQSVYAIEFVNRGNQTLISTSYNKDLNFSSCILCGQCIMVCPTAALHEKDNLPEIEEALNNSSKKVVVQIDPSVSVSLAEEFGVKAGKDFHGILVSALRKIGFDVIFDTSFGADLAVMEMAEEFISKKKENPDSVIFPGFCPGWVKFAEQFRPDLLASLSAIKSPQQILGSVIKNYYSEKSGIPAEKIYSVSVSSCTARKFESQREEMTSKGISDIDVVITTRELAKLVKLYGIDLENLEVELGDEPYAIRSTAGKLSAVSGGITEAFIRTLYFKLTGKEFPGIKIPELRGLKGRKEYVLKLGKEQLTFAVVSGLNNARILLEDLEAGKVRYDFIEVMACPGGCINGGGQPIRPEEGCLKARMKTIYDTDEKEMIRVAHKNPKVLELYEEYLKNPGDESFKTRFLKRTVLI
jgi:iron-only hydrogenase group A